MAIIRNTAGQGLYIYAHDIANDEPETGDAANITATISLDGAAAGALTDVNPTEIGGGVYWFDLTQAETNAAALSLVSTSVTADVQIDPVLVLTQEATIADAVWDELLTGATHNIPASAGRRLRQLADTVIIDGTVVSSTDNTVVLDAGASALDGAYDPALIYISSGTGAGQCRLILQYDGAARRCWVDRNWKYDPVAGDEYVIIGDAGREHVNEGHAQGGTANTITLNTLASDEDDAYNGQVVFIRSGTGEDQARRITAYNGTTHVATVYPDWDVTPDTTSAGAILPTAVMTNDQLKTAIWDVLTSDLTDAGSIGRLLVERLDATIGSRAQPGDAMTLTLAERQAVGSEVWEGTDGLAILTALFSELNAIQTQTDRIGTGDVFVVAPVRENGDVDMVIGDVYSAARNRAMTWTGEAWDIPASSAVVVVVQGVAVFNATRLAANQVRLELTSAQSATLVPGPHTFHIREIPGDGQPITHLTGAWVARTEPAPMPST